MQKGFTLVELSIVLVVIGLLVGGVLVGQSLIETARTGRLIRDLQQYEIATNQFKTKFKKYPGDSQFFNPPGAPNNILSSGDTDGDGLENATSCNTKYRNVEAEQFWAHLSQAQMIKTIYPAYEPTLCPPGTHSLDLSQYMPYTRVDPSAVGSFFEGGNGKNAITPYKSSASKNLYFELYTLSMDTLALESKLGSQADDLTTEKYVGLTNTVGVNLCAHASDPSVNCNSSEAIFGALRYYLAP